MMTSQNSADSLSAILAFQSVHPRLMTSGQPTFDQFGDIARAGFSTVVNLALTDASNAIAGEDRCVLALGMDYLQLPLLFDQPTLSQALRVLAVVDELQREKVWLHCALNKRVSSLMYVYRTCYLGMDAAEAQALLYQVWTPNDPWLALIVALEQHFLKR